MLQRCRTFLRAVLRRRDMERDLDAEIRFHLSEETDERVSAGETRRDAMLAAQKDFGSSTYVREAVREAWGGRFLDGLLQDWRFAVRSATRAPALSLVIVITLGLAIGLNTAVFAFVNTILLRGLPFQDPARIVSLATTDASGRPLGVSRLDFLDWREQLHSLDGLAAFQQAIMNVSDPGRPAEMRRGPYCTSNLFSLVGLAPMIGRNFTSEDERPGAEATVILGHALWSGRYGQSPDVIGQFIRVNGEPARVIGVMPEGIHFPGDSDLWLSWSALPAGQRAAPRQVRSLSAFGRLRQGATIQEARTELQTVAHRLAQDYPASNADVGPTLQPYQDESNTRWLVIAPERIRLIFFSLWGAVSAVLLIACANVANLLLLRGSHRSREIAIRLSLGAGRWRIARQLLVESALLALAGCLLGLGVSLLAIRMFGGLLATHPGKPTWMTFDIDVHVLLYAVLAGAATALLSGVLPAIQLSRVDTRGTAQELSARSTVAHRPSLWTGPLTVLEVTLTIVLLAAAGFMLRSFVTLYSTDLGVDTSRLMTMSLFLPGAQYRTAASRIAFFDRLQQRFSAIPGVQECALASTYPLTTSGPVRRLSVEGQGAPDADALPRVLTMNITPNYFETLGVHLLAGRGLSVEDEVVGGIGAVVNERFATTFLAGHQPVGSHITLSGVAVQVGATSPPMTATVVGVVPDLGQRIQEDTVPLVYLPFHTDPLPGMFVVVRSPSDRGSLAHALQEEMRVEDPDVPLMEIQTMDNLLARTWWSQRVFGSMFSAFAFFALVLSAICLYSGISYTVARRTSEIGVRMALGATAADVVWTVARRSLGQLAIALPVGVAGALAVGQLLQSLLVRTSGRDPITVLGIAAVMAGVSFVACVVPARRAARLDPVSALRVE